jgi:hypothetical protein
MRKVIATTITTLALLTLATPAAHADPITCPPGQAATLNPSDGGWVCVNQGGNTNNSEDPRPDSKDKGDFRH